MLLAYHKRKISSPSGNCCDVWHNWHPQTMSITCLHAGCCHQSSNEPKPALALRQTVHMCSCPIASRSLQLQLYVPPFIGESFYFTRLEYWRRTYAFFFTDRGCSSQLIMTPQCTSTPVSFGAPTTGTVGVECQWSARAPIIGHRRRDGFQVKANSDRTLITKAVRWPLSSYRNFQVNRLRVTDRPREARYVFVTLSSQLS